MSDDRARTGSCVICGERDPHPNLVPAAPVCGPCRSRLRGQVAEIPGLCAVLAAGPRPELEAGPARLVVDVDVQVLDDGQLVIHRSEHGARPVHVNAGAVPGQPAGPRVASTGEAPTPVRVDVVDLLAPADERTARDKHLVPAVQLGAVEEITARYGRDDIVQRVRPREAPRATRPSRCRCGNPELHADHRPPIRVLADDQVGAASAATVLHRWCRDLARRRRETTPAEHPAAQCRYLTDRLDWAYVEHPHMAGLAADVGDLWHALRRAAGLAQPKPELCQGVPCRNIDCDLKTLYRVPGSDYVECASCGLLLTEAEYQTWVRLLAAAVKRTRSVA